MRSLIFFRHSKTIKSIPLLSPPYLGLKIEGKLFFKTLSSPSAGHFFTSTKKVGEVGVNQHGHKLVVVDGKFDGPLTTFQWRGHCTSRQFPPIPTSQDTMGPRYPLFDYEKASVRSISEELATKILKYMEADYKNKFGSQQQQGPLQVTVNVVDHHPKWEEPQTSSSSIPPVEVTDGSEWVSGEEPVQRVLIMDRLPRNQELMEFIKRIEASKWRGATYEVTLKTP